MIPRTILVADDDRLLRESLCDMLSDLGLAPRPVGCGNQAIALLSQVPCDVVLSDVDMPDMTGFALLDWMHLHQLRRPAVLMSARADADLDRAAQRAGALALLPKPVEVARIAALVHSLFPSTDRAPRED